jgi:hypothetical protein
MSESLQQIPSKSDGSNKSLVKVWDSKPAEIELERDELRIANTTELMRKRALAEPEQLSLYG